MVIGTLVTWRLRLPRWSRPPVVPILCAVLVVLAPCRAAQATIDPQEGPLTERVARALAHHHLDDQLETLSLIGEHLAPDEIPAALKLADGLVKLCERSVLRESALKRWARLEPAQAFAAIAALPEGSIKAETLRYAAVRLTREDVSVATTAALALPAGRSQSEAIQGVAETWARTAPEKASAWAMALPPGETRERALYQVRFVWVHADPSGAARHVIPVIPAGNIKNAMLTNIAMEWALLDPAATIQWAEGLVDSTERDLAMARAAESWTDDDPRAASDFALQFPPGVSRQRVVSTVASRWAIQDPKAAAEFAMNLKEAELRQPALAAVMQLWASVLPAEAGQWVESLSPDLPREDALTAYLTAVVKWAPDMGLRIIARAAPKMAARGEAEACARQWLALDYTAARTWIDDSKFPQEIKTKWLTPAHH